MSDDDTRYDDPGSPETTDGQIRPEGARPGEPPQDLPGAHPVGEGPSEGGPVTADTGGAAHTPAADGHPVLADDSEGRSARDVGGPRLADEERATDGSTTTGAAKGDIQTKGLDAHE